MCFVTKKLSRLAKNANVQLKDMRNRKPLSRSIRRCTIAGLSGSRIIVVGMSHSIANGDMYASKLKLSSRSEGSDRRIPCKGHSSPCHRGFPTVSWENRTDVVKGQSQGLERQCEDVLPCAHGTQRFQLWQQRKGSGNTYMRELCTWNTVLNPRRAVAETQTRNPSKWKLGSKPVAMMIPRTTGIKAR